MNTEPLETSGLDTHPWPEQLTGHVVMPSEPRRVHGYDVESDLARAAVSGNEMLLLMLTGEVPSSSAARALDVAMAFLSPVLVTEGPAHAAVVARLCQCPTSAVIATAAIATAERARGIVAEHAELIDWLPGVYGAPPEACLGTETDGLSVARLRAALAPTGLTVPALPHGLTRMASLLAVLHACGLDSAARMEAALVFAQLPCVVAEALSHTPGDLRGYPINLPRVRYEGGTP